MPELLIKERVIKIIIEQLSVSREECTPEADLVDNLGANSTKIKKLIIGIKESFQVEISNDELKRIRTIRGIVGHIIDELTEVM